MNRKRYYYDRITTALDDLLRCRRYCEAMLKLPVGVPFSEERTVYEALFVAFIVSYCRTFNASNTVDNEFKELVSGDFGKFRKAIIERQENSLQMLHERIVKKRDTAIAHSDGNSRDFRHYGNTSLAIGRNPYVPYDHEEVDAAMLLVDSLISEIGSEQCRVGKLAFKDSIFGESKDG